MGSIVEAALYDVVGKFFLLFVIMPAGVIFLGYVIYMIAKIIQERRKDRTCSKSISHLLKYIFSITWRKQCLIFLPMGLL